MASKKKTFQFFPILLSIILAFTYTFILANPLDLTNSDIGRHLINGREILQQHWEILFKNTYSYTMPDQSFVNHHWLAGVIFWLSYQLNGFLALHIFHTIILLIFLLTLFYLLSKKSSWSTGFLLSLLAIVFLATRVEVRPESFGFLLLTIYLLVIHHLNKTKQVKLSSFLIITITQLIWVNLHISFVFGLFVFGLFTLIELTINKTFNQKNKKKLIILLVTLCLTSLFNPNTIQGALSPFTIFQDYGYKVYENQNLWFLRNYYRGPILPLFYLIAGIIITLLFIFPEIALFEKALAVTGIFLGWSALRNIPIFVIFTFPFLALALQQTFSYLKTKITFEEPKLTKFIVITIPLVLLWLSLASNPYFQKKAQGFQFGLLKQQPETLSFLAKIPPKARIFNNYDVGSALVFSLYPENKVFVDNRPEAYSSSFFQDLYIPAQSSELTWKKADEKYDFNFIIFGHRDITPWAQIFIKNRLRDNLWKIIYIDDFIFIFAKDTPENKPLIDQYAIEVPLSRLKF
ncbi:MAG: hypothetical protein IT416_02035 [Candidatus Pacebacteria bacterium]|nr:hypothetical protein [Candidatus Paceibacterota bacterium]